MSLMFILAGAAFLAIAIYVIFRDKRYMRESTVVSGKVLAIKESKVKNSGGSQATFYIPIIEYYAEGKTWRFKGDNQGIGHTLKSGQSVPIRIQHGNHKVARVEHDIKGLNAIIYLFIPLGAGAIITGMALFDSSELSSSAQWLPLVIGLLVVSFKILPRLSRNLSRPEFEESKEVVGSSSN